MSKMRYTMFLHRTHVLFEKSSLESASSINLLLWYYTTSLLLVAIPIQTRLFHCVQFLVSGNAQEFVQRCQSTAQLCTLAAFLWLKVATFFCRARYQCSLNGQCLTGKSHRFLDNCGFHHLASWFGSFARHGFHLIFGKSYFLLYFSRRWDFMRRTCVLGNLVQYVFLGHSWSSTSCQRCCPIPHLSFPCKLQGWRSTVVQLGVWATSSQQLKRFQ